MGGPVVRVLLDTHALLWWLAGDRALSQRASATIADEESLILVSAATAWEICTKHRLGKLPGVTHLVENFASVLADQAFEVLDVTLDHACRAGSLPGQHRDPFDRMLIAQTQALGVAIVSVDEVFDGYGVKRIW